MYGDISYILGLSTMLFGMMAVAFWRRGGRLYRLVALLTATLALQCVKDFIVMGHGLFAVGPLREAVTALDMVAVPMYAFVLTELVRPGKLTVRSMVHQEMPFVALPLLYIDTQAIWIFYVELAWATIYGCGYMVWTMMSIPRYNRHLKEVYSYTENVNLSWLSVILYTFFVLLCLWIVDCVLFNLSLERVYFICNLVFWMIIYYFLSRHETVLAELSEWTPEETAKPDSVAAISPLASKIEELFRVQHIYLNPDLMLSDVVRAVGSNRTYVSNFFNSGSATSFYDFVNSYRISRACTLLSESDIPIQEVATKSGFNSASVFSRVFSKLKGCTPTAFRESAKSAGGGNLLNINPLYLQ